MVVQKGIPEFKLILNDYVGETSFNPDGVFYCLIESYKGPMNEPVMINSISMGKTIFGVDFSPFFFQNPDGVLGVIRVGSKEPKQASLEYKGKDGAVVLKIKSKDFGTDKKEFKIVAATTGAGKYNVLISIPDFGSRSYTGLNSIYDITQRVSDTFGDFFEVEYIESAEPLTPSELKVVPPEGIDDNDEGYVPSYVLHSGSNGYELDQEGNIMTETVGGATVNISVPEDGKFLHGHTVSYAYKQALLKLENIDLFGIFTLSDAPETRVALIEHLEMMTQPEVGRERMVVTSSLFYNQTDSGGDQVIYSIQDLIKDARLIDNPHVVYVGQGVRFDNGNEIYDLKPHEATMLYAGKRSALSYGEAIGGGESKKVLRGVVGILDISNDGYIVSKQDRIDLNESGVMQFQDDYFNNFNEPSITFLEGVTTEQTSSELSQEQIMSISMHVIKRLVRVARPYMQKVLTSDLKGTFETALNNELLTIKDTDKTLIDLTDPLIDAYNVRVQAVVSAKQKPDGRFHRESKFIAHVTIVPVGALRQIDLNTIVV